MANGTGGGGSPVPLVFKLGMDLILHVELR